MSPHLLRLTLLALLSTLAAAHPKALECGSDSTTRLRVGQTIMMASVADAGAGAAATVTVSGSSVTVHADAGVFFAVRAVGAGATLSVGPGDLAETADCTSQVYYNGTGTSAGTWTLSHTKATSIVLGYASAPGVVSLVTAHIAPSPPTPPPAPAALPVTSAGSLALGSGGDLRFSWTTTRDASSATGGVLRARMEIDRKDCWAAVGFSSSSAADMVGADFLVGERDLHTHVPAVNAYKYWKASEPIPVPTGNGSSVRLLATEMTATGSVWIFERDLVPADAGQTAIQGKVNLIWATCD